MGLRALKVRLLRVEFWLQHAPREYWVWIYE
jgi:hypothetical protein